MATDYLHFIRGLDNETFRELVRKDSVPLLPPYDSLVVDVLGLTDVTSERINTAAKLYLHPDDMDILITLESDQQLAIASYKRLVDHSIRDEAVKYLEYPSGDMSEVLDKVDTVLQKRHIFIPEHRAKGWDELEDRDDDVLMHFLKYEIDRDWETLNT